MGRIFDSNGEVACDEAKKGGKDKKEKMAQEGSGSEGSGEDFGAIIDSAVDPLENLLESTVGHCKKFKTFNKNVQKIKKAMHRAAALL